MDLALNDHTKATGVFDSVRKAFRIDGARKLHEQIQQVYDFRNTYIAHQNQELKDADLAKRNLIAWIVMIHILETRQFHE